MFKGYRSIVSQIPMLLFALLSMFGVIVPAADQAVLVAAASSIIAVVMRLITTTAVGEST